jgi:hypothetical protein
MFKRSHHQKIGSILLGINADLLRELNCYFGGGTAIALRRPGRPYEINRWFTEPGWLDGSVLKRPVHRNTQGKGLGAG